MATRTEEINRIDDVSSVDPASEINREHQLARAAFQRGLEHARRCGELLIREKDRLDHGQFLPWLREHCEFSERMASGYMRIARKWPTLEARLEDRQRVADLPVREALALLADPKPKNVPRTITSEPPDTA